MIMKSITKIMLICFAVCILTACEQEDTSFYEETTNSNNKDKKEHDISSEIKNTTNASSGGIRLCAGGA